MASASASTVRRRNADTWTGSALGARFSSSLEEVRRRLEVEPGVAGVTFVDQLPRDYHAERLLEVESMPSDSSLWVGTASIYPSDQTVTP